MDYLNNLVDNTSSWWNSSTHIDSKKENKGDLILLRSNLFSEYVLYERVISAYRVIPNNPTFISAEKKKLLLDYYNNPPVKLKDKLKERRNNNLQVCPYCGSFTHPNTLDHFIPKDGFPHYAIFQNNLVPQCRRCASIKGDRYYKPSEGCIFIHPFYCDVLSKVRFEIAMSFDSNINSIVINAVKIRNHDFKAIEIQRLKIHLESLEVKSRMKEYCLKEFKELRRKAKKYYFDLDQWIHSKISILEINGTDWCTAFYESLQNCNNAKQFLNSLMPSPRITSTTLAEKDVQYIEL
ncbi:HNH endonuclease family protein [Acinetobacter baumannii 1437282]|nr:HNH endonuclease family protein [Acinetobacter baumannii 1437282]